MLSYIYVDADSCPVKDEILKSSARHNIEVYWVSNRWTTQLMGSKVHKILVPSGADVADDWIVNHIKENDIVVTSDILLAQRCLKLLAYVVAPNGKRFTDENIGISVAMRDLNKHLREAGEINSYNKEMTKRDKSNFLQELEKIIQEISRI